MCTFPDHDGVVAMDRPNEVGIPALEATDSHGPQGSKVDHFMTRGVCIGQLWLVIRGVEG
jgi:hypothetical protein